MKEGVLDVLMYLFEHCFDEDTDVESDEALLREELADAGFPPAEIAKAFDWLEGLTAEHEGIPSGAVKDSAVTRIYTAHERERLDLECRGLLMFLEQVGVLDPLTRELVIDRVMALGTDGIDVEQLKWVVLVVLFNQPGRDSMLQWMEDVVFERTHAQLH